MADHTPVTVRSVPFDHPAAVALRAAMNDELSERYADRLGDPGIATAQAIDSESVAYTGLAEDGDGQPVGHVMLRWLGADLEVKRVYVPPSVRGSGVAVALMDAAERYARAHGAARLILQTGDRQPAAVRLYEKTGYTLIPVFPPYDTLAFSLCFAKSLVDPATTPASDARTPHRC